MIFWRMAQIPQAIVHCIECKNYAHGKKQYYKVLQRFSVCFIVLKAHTLTFRNYFVNFSRNSLQNGLSRRY